MTLPKILKPNSTLRSLRLSMVKKRQVDANLSNPETVSNVIAALQLLPNLQYLDLSTTSQHLGNCCIDKTSEMLLCSYIGENETLIALDISKALVTTGCNHLEEGTVVIAGELRFNTSLRKLNLSREKLKSRQCWDKEGRCG